ncbi:TonB-dependent siderophore receptor [Hymenobacter sp. HMF4947]|uniref:TonB-dependent siderophore receptor n=1 Tax=Hymenobacter ginkgonis TaxID=2682976 RepID=A0A7K1THR8_9BACT|nr:TonB-dependent receptor [Hymenobacter ginkgonis]MVN77970.1 TonB-dependent siderophore receptor [Hymenobacter ginkgonis]
MNNHRYLLLPLVVCAVSATAQAQSTGTISGRVTNSNGGAVEAVSVGVEGQAKGDITDEQGRFRIRQLAPGQYTLVVSAVGLKTEQQTVTVVSGQTAAINFTLAESAAELKEVVVSGARTNKFNRRTSVDVSKMPLQNLENPQVYATIGKELLTEQLVFSVDDATRNAPGLQKMWEPTGRGGDGGSFYASRGFVVSSQLRNGVAGSVTSTIDAANLEKLEVIKGPSATLYGSALTSYGGLLNRVTKKPYETFGGEVAVSGGSYAFHRVSADVNTPLNKAKTLAFRLNTAYQYEDSWQNVGYAGFVKNLAIAPSLQFRPTDRLTINLDAEVYRGTNVGKQLIYFSYGDPIKNLGFSRADQAPLDYRQSYQGPGLTQDSRSTNLFGQVRYRLSPSFTSTTYLTSSRSYSQGYGPYFYLVSNTAATVGTANPITTPGLNSLSRNDQSTQDSHSQTFEVQQLFNGDFQLGSLRNRVVLGLDFLRIDSNLDYFGGFIDAVKLGGPADSYRTFNANAVNAAYAANSPSHYLVTTKVNTYSAFASDVLNLTDQLSVLAAVRVDRYDNKGGLFYSPVNAYAQTAISPKFGLVYQPVKDRVALFANYQNSFTNQNSVFLDAQGGSNVTKPERANQVEGGVKLDAAGGRVSATVSYYDIRVQNILRTTGYNAAGVALGVQDGTQWSRGAELNLTANPLPGLNIVGGFAYNYSIYVNTNDDVNGYRPATASSPYLANAWVSYRQPEGPLKGLGLGFGGNYASDNKVVNSKSLGSFTLPEYTVLNASVFYDLQHYRFSAKVDNLTDKHYWIGYTTMNAQKLRSIVGQVAYKF